MPYYIHPSYALERRRVQFFFLGLGISAALFLSAVEYGTYEPVISQHPFPDPVTWTIESVSPSVIIPKHPAPPKPVKHVDHTLPPRIVEHLIPIVSHKSATVIPSSEGSQHNPPIIAPVSNNPVYSLPEANMPYFSDCAGEGEEYRFNCSAEKIGSILKQRLKGADVSQLDRSNRTIYVSFLISTSGLITQVKLLNHLTPEIDREVLNAMQDIPPMEPGMQNGHLVPVQLRIPVSFAEIDN